MKRITFFLSICFGILMSIFYPRSVYATDPVQLVPSNATDFDIAAPKLFWRELYCTLKPPGVTGQAQAAQNQPQAPAVVYAEAIRRIAVDSSQPRTLFSLGTDSYCGFAGNQSIVSNIVADANYLYYTTDSALVRLPTTANVGDAPEILLTGVKGDAELVQLGDQVWVLNRQNGVGAFWRVNKTSGEVVFALLVNGNAHSLAVVQAGFFNAKTLVVWREGGTVYRYNASDGGDAVIGLNVESYTAEGNISFCQDIACGATSYVFMSTGTQIYRYNNVNNQSILIYDTGNANTTVSNLIADGNNLFFFETYTEPCGGFTCPSTTTLKRRGRGNTGNTDSLLIKPPDNNVAVLQIKQNGNYLFWREVDGRIMRFPKNAAALPVVNLRVTGMRVVQSVYDQNNSVPLIERKRTFVRLLVRSDGVSVPNVQAYLARSNDPNNRRLLPVNTVGTRLTVLSSPSISNTDHAFLFELPWDWTTGEHNLVATLNPYRVPLEPDYSDNTSQFKVKFILSPLLSLEFFRLAYRLNGTTYAPRIREDVLAIYSWLMRAYPLGGAIGENFRPRLWYVNGGNQLGTWVQNSDEDCDKDEIGDEDRQFCAAFYTHGWLEDFRDDGDIPNANGFYYGMISDAAGFFPRGLAIGGTRSSVGPVGAPIGSWDTDTTYGDWYAGHEIGHSLGRGHLNKGTPCNNTPRDNNYPYPNSFIGPRDGSVEGFDVGDPSFGIAPTLLPDTIWTDLMDYCNNQWISPYTYNALWLYMLQNPSAQQVQSAQVNQQTGNWLAISGVIDPDIPSVSFSRFRQITTLAHQPALQPGGYFIRQLAANNSFLTEDEFTPHAEAEAEALGFSQVVTLATNTRIVQIVRKSDNRVLGSRLISVNPPTIGSVTLLNASNPVDGTVTLQWTASDADGDDLSFDIFYSRDNGVSYQPVQMLVTGNSSQIDSSTLGGSQQARFRVVASDGFHQTSAQSEAFVMADKAPQPFILAPADQSQIEYGQLINFNAAAFDPVDQVVASSGFVWHDAKGNLLGNGALISSDTLPVGRNVITVTATNSVGRSSSLSVTILVRDELTAPNSTLAVGPSSLGWHVTAEITDIQQGILQISNLGFGDLNWQASSDQSWLTLSTTNGSIAEGGNPATLQVQANPIALDANQSHRAHITVVQPAREGVLTQTIVIPVTLGKGDTWNPPAVITPTKQSQSINFADLPARLLSESPILLNATADSGLPVSFYSGTPSVCMVNGNQLTLLTVGTCVVTSQQTGNEVYRAATPVRQSFSVGSGGQPAGGNVYLPLVRR